MSKQNITHIPHPYLWRPTAGHLFTHYSVKSSHSQGSSYSPRRAHQCKDWSFYFWWLSRCVKKLSFMFSFDLSYDSLTVQVWLSVGGCLDIFWMLNNSQVSKKVIFINLHFSYCNSTAQVWLSVGGYLEIFECWKIPRWVEKLSFMFTFDLAYDCLTVQVWLSVRGYLDIFWMLKNYKVSRKFIFINLHFSYYNLTAQVWLSVGGCLENFQMLRNSQVSRKVIFHVHIWLVIW